LSRSSRRPVVEGWSCGATTDAGLLCAGELVHSQLSAPDEARIGRGSRLYVCKDCNTVQWVPPRLPLVKP